MKKHISLLLLLAPAFCLQSFAADRLTDGSTSTSVSEKAKYAYQDKTLPVERRVDDLLQRMSVEEKVKQISAQLLFMDEFFDKRDYAIGHIRNIGHFLWEGQLPNDAKSVAKQINNDTRHSIEASRWGIPVMQHGEALHGAQWGNATCFPQSIAMAATFDDDLYYKEAQVVAKELRAVGVRQVYAPVINVTRDQRWGRCQESYGEDVLINSRMGVAYVKALEEGGVIATPKHFVDNYGEGGHDSYASANSWRELREVYLEPFRACFEEGGAHSVMAAYNSVDGVPASCSSRLLKDILKGEWNFDGYVVSDYGGVEIVCRSHRMTSTEDESLALCLENGLDLQLANTSDNLLQLVNEGKVSMETLDESVRRVLRLKFMIGLFDQPYVDPEEAGALVRCDEHRMLAEQCARKTMTLLKNNGILPLDKQKVKHIGVFGPSADILNLGDYSGGRGGWRGEAGVTPLQGLKKAFEGVATVELNKPGQDVDDLAARSDVLIFFPSIAEEEGSDRGSFKLPSSHVTLKREDTDALIVDDGQEVKIEIDQERMVRDLIKTGKPVIVVLHNGAMIDITEWVDGAAAVLEAWYPGEQGGTAIAEVISGKYNPGGRLPLTWAKSIGQIPMHYAIKPSGRGYSYVDNDGKPLYPFGYGLSYTTFDYSDFQTEKTVEAGQPLHLSLNLTNTGSMAGDEVVQVYIRDEQASVVRPMKQLAAFKRVELKAGERKTIQMEIPYRQFGMWNQDMQFGVEEGWFEVWLGKNANEIIAKERVYVKN